MWECLTPIFVWPILYPKYQQRHICHKYVSLRTVRSRNWTSKCSRDGNATAIVWNGLNSSMGSHSQILNDTTGPVDKLRLSRTSCNFLAETRPSLHETVLTGWFGTKCARTSGCEPMFSKHGTVAGEERLDVSDGKYGMGVSSRCRICGWDSMNHKMSPSGYMQMNFRRVKRHRPPINQSRGNS